MTGNAPNWLFDLGNSRLKCAPCRDGVLGETVFVNHDGQNFAAGWEALLPMRIEHACVASVARSGLTDTLLATLATRCDSVASARTVPDCAGVRIAYAEPENLGVDRFLALLAARARNTRPVLIVGVGTALTIDLLDGDGLHRGGRIAPSPDAMRAALNARAPKLPKAGGRYREFATDTADALVSGCHGAALGLIEASVHAATALLATPPQLLLHGGGAHAFHAQLPEATLAPVLVLEGLAQWSRHDV